MSADTRKPVPHPQRPGSPWSMLKSTVNNWLSDQASSISAALAFYSAFSIAPLLVISVAAIGWIVGAESADRFIGEQLELLFGQSTAKLVVQAMHSARQTQGIWATIVSIVTLIVGASTVFGALESALRQVWGANVPQTGGWRGFVRTRIVSFGFILAVGFLLLISLTMTTALSGLRGWVAHRYEGLVAMLGVLEFVVSTALGTGLIALMYRYLPAVRLAWRHVFTGALVTLLLQDSILAAWTTPLLGHPLKLAWPWWMPIATSVAFLVCIRGRPKAQGSGIPIQLNTATSTASPRPGS